MSQQGVDFETAKLLKEKGYDVPCRDYYHPHNGLSESSHPDDFNRDTWAKGYYSAPTLHEAADWLRGKGLHVRITPMFDWELWAFTIHAKGQDLTDGSIFKFPDHDAALAAAITHALTLVE